MADFPTSKAAAEILELINSRPQTPRLDELESIIARAQSSTQDRATDGPEDKIVGPVLGTDGRPIEFGYTNVEFGDEFCPWIRMAFLTLGYDDAGLRDFACRLAHSEQEDEGDDDYVSSLLDAWEVIDQKFSAIAEFARVASARTLDALATVEVRNG